jgi:putative endopeptidase
MGLQMKTRTYILFFVLVVALLTIIGCGPKSGGDQSVREDVLRMNIDSTVSPAKDFFAYANGTWLKNHPIPASESRWGIGNVVHEETYSRLREICEQAAANRSATPGSPLQKIGDMYFTGMDSAGIEQQGIRPLQGELDRINAIQDRKQLLDVLALYKTYRVGVFFDLDIYQDMKNSEKMAIYISQGGLGLPNRDYYFNNDARTVNIRKEYVSHLSKMMQLLGESPAVAATHSDIIMRIETALAKSSRKLEDLRDPYRNYNKMTVDGLNKLSPSMRWGDLLVAAGITGPDSVIVGQPEFVTELEHSMKNVSIEDWKVYLRWHLINTFADKLSTPFDNQDFAFYGTVLEGKSEQRARWKRVIDAIEGQMGELLGQLYVEKYFSPVTKKRYENLVDNILLAYGERIRNLDWMTPATKEKALAKLATVSKKVGYPDRWRDYSTLTASRDSR